MHLEKEKEFNHHFLGYGLHDTEIVVHYFKSSEKNIIVAEDLGKGTSVTNAIEQIATEVIKKLDIDPRKTIFIECYPYYAEWELDSVELTYDSMSKEYSNPVWFRPHKLSSEIINQIKISISESIKKREKKNPE